MTSALYTKNLGSYIDNFFQIEARRNGNKRWKGSHIQAEVIPYFNVDQLYEHIPLIMNNKKKKKKSINYIISFFIGYINNAMMKQIVASIPSDFMYFYRTVVHINIKGILSTTFVFFHTQNYCCFPY